MKFQSSYGTARTRAADVSYGQIEAAAQAILATGVRPTVDGVRAALKSGSQRTLLNGLQRFWQELGSRLSGVPDSRRRLPAAVADLADTLWQTALTLATDAAEGSDAALKAQLAQLWTDTEVRGHALAQREIEMESLVRSRERTIRELEEHLRATMTLVNKRDAAILSLDSRLATAVAETGDYRQRLTKVIERAGVRHQVRPPARPVMRTRSSARRKKSAPKMAAQLKRLKPKRRTAHHTRASGS